jgi:hypothetical protein
VRRIETTVRLRRMADGDGGDAETREDITQGHSDMVHYCGEVDREFAQVVLHSLCDCAS